MLFKVASNCADRSNPPPRDLFTNRKIARRILRDKLELVEKGGASKLGKRMAKIKKRKYNAARWPDLLVCRFILLELSILMHL